VSFTHLQGTCLNTLERHRQERQHRTHRSGDTRRYRLRAVECQHCAQLGDVGNLLGTFGENGTSVFGWWVTQDVAFQQNYSNQFAIVMAQEIVAGTAE